MTTPQPNTLALTRTEVPALPENVQRLVLTGFMGAGKSTVGRMLAARLRWGFLDLDVHLEQRTRATIPQLFERHGERRFRRLESTALAHALRRTGVVLALGGGTPEETANQLLLEAAAGTLTIFLDAPFDTLFHRCMLQDLENSNVRPILADRAEAQLRFARRQPLYRRLAALTIETSDLTPAQTVELLLRNIYSLNQTPHSRT